MANIVCMDVCMSVDVGEDNYSVWWMNTTTIDLPNWLNNLMSFIPCVLEEKECERMRDRERERERGRDREREGERVRERVSTPIHTHVLCVETSHAMYSRVNTRCWKPQFPTNSLLPVQVLPAPVYIHTYIYPTVHSVHCTVAAIHVCMCYENWFGKDTSKVHSDCHKDTITYHTLLRTPLCQYVNIEYTMH